MLILDFDGTVYDANNPISKEIDDRVKQFLLNRIKHTTECSLVELENKYPNILNVLDMYSLDRDIYKKEVYSNLSYNYLIKNMELYDIFCRVTLKKIVISLAPLKHICKGLKSLGIYDCIDSVVSIYEIKEENEKYNQIIKICNEENMDFNQVVVIGDSWENDLREAFEHGIEVCKIGYDELLAKKGIKCYANIFDCLQQYI